MPHHILFGGKKSNFSGENYQEKKAKNDDFSGKQIRPLEQLRERLQLWWLSERIPLLEQALSKLILPERALSEQIPPD